MLSVAAKTRTENHPTIRFPSTYGKPLRKRDKQFPDWPHLGLRGRVFTHPKIAYSMSSISAER
jgi:hypothetical protein